MLNYDTILSNYDDKLTLMQWLKKVEDALKDASAVSFDVVNLGNATFKFKIVFEDGSEIESDPLVVNQGDSVASAAIVNGDLILTLTNGDTINAGSMFDGNVNITGTLTCAGDVLINANLTAGEIVGSKVSSTGLLTASGNVSFNSDLAVVGTATANKLKQALPNEVFTGTWTYDATKYELTDIYTAFEEINGVLFAIANIHIKRLDDGNVYYIGSFNASLSNAIAERVYDMKGSTARTTPAQPVVITANKAVVYTAVEGPNPSPTLSYNITLNLLNLTYANGVALYLSGNGEAITTGTELYITARIPLTII